jgi:AbrB family looped-hinge helix DNA binding protein
MHSKSSATSVTAVEATVTSKGQVTLPKALRSQVGIDAGSRIRFSLHPGGGIEVHPVLHDLEDLWKMADAGGMLKGVMTFEEMNEAKARRKW